MDRVKPRDLVLEEIHHNETAVVPYTLAFEEHVGIRLDEYFGNKDWRGKVIRNRESLSHEYSDSEPRQSGTTGL